MNKRITTKDGSHTIYSEHFSEYFHSINGAIQESMHIFINAGLRAVSKKEISVFEVGFGTGLNAFLTAIEAVNSSLRIQYTAIELFPLDYSEANLLNYSEIIGRKELFNEIHVSEWEKPIEINSNFWLKKIKADLLTDIPNQKFDLVFFDAFSPNVQPELWTESVFQKIYATCNEGAILTTYSVKGVVKRALQKCGFVITKLPGPPGKREFIRAIKN